MQQQYIADYLAVSEKKARKAKKDKKKKKKKHSHHERASAASPSADADGAADPAAQDSSDSDSDLEASVARSMAAALDEQDEQSSGIRSPPKTLPKPTSAAVSSPSAATPPSPRSPFSSSASTSTPTPTNPSSQPPPPAAASDARRPSLASQSSVDDSGDRYVQLEIQRLALAEQEAAGSAAAAPPPPDTFFSPVSPGHTPAPGSPAPGHLAGPVAVEVEDLPAVRPISWDTPTDIEFEFPNGIVMHGYLSVLAKRCPAFAQYQVC